jgi:hypothetical protein
LSQILHDLLGSQKRRKVHKGSQAAAISRKSVLNNPAILAAWNGKKLSGAIMSPLMTYQEAAN